jgi:hypothetical protein
MNADQVNWLLRTIKTPETAKRFIGVQYERGRISYHVMVNLVRDHGWTDLAAFKACAPTPNPMESATTVPILTITGVTS